jgi:UDPglucose 6-dehydrogenase
MNPEFVLIGSNSEKASDELALFYDFISAPKLKMNIESAELTKVAYNTFIGMKIVFANSLSEISEKTGANVDDVTNALSMANKRIMSSQYLTAGMGDGGGCHPRDQIAMSWLAEELDMSVDIFDFVARSRDNQTLRQAKLISELSELHKLPITILGEAYKPNSPLSIGSPVRLLTYYLDSLGKDYKIYDSYLARGNESLLLQKSLFFLGTRHVDFEEIYLESGSVLIDPWAFSKSLNPLVKVIRPGRN